MQNSKKVESSSPIEDQLLGLRGVDGCSSLLASFFPPFLGSEILVPQRLCHHISHLLDFCIRAGQSPSVNSLKQLPTSFTRFLYLSL